MRLTATMERTATDASAPHVAELNALILELADKDHEVVRHFLERAADATERHAARLAKAADTEAHDALTVPLPARWA